MQSTQCSHLVFAAEYGYSLTDSVFAEAVVVVVVQAVVRVEGCQEIAALVL